MISLNHFVAESENRDTILEPARILLAWRGYFAKLSVARQLRKEGYTVDIAHNAEGIFHALQSRDYACILLDVEMPGMNGLMTAQRIRQGWRESSPYLLGRIDSPYDEDHQAIIDKGGMDACITPQTSHEEVISLIARLIADKLA